MDFFRSLPVDIVYHIALLFDSHEMYQDIAVLDDRLFISYRHYNARKHLLKYTRNIYDSFTYEFWKLDNLFHNEDDQPAVIYQYHDFQGTGFTINYFYMFGIFRGTSKIKTEYVDRLDNIK